MQMHHLVAHSYSAEGQTDQIYQKILLSLVRPKVCDWVDFVTTHDLSGNLVQCFSILCSHVDVFVELW